VEYSELCPRVLHIKSSGYGPSALRRKGPPEVGGTVGLPQAMVETCIYGEISNEGGSYKEEGIPTHICALRHSCQYHAYHSRLEQTRPGPSLPLGKLEEGPAHVQMGRGGLLRRRKFVYALH